MLNGIVLRYSGMAMQFAMAILVSRTFGAHDSGIYFMVFGLVISTYFISGAGLPDGIVRFVTIESHGENLTQVRALIYDSALYTALISLLIGAVISGVCLKLTGSLPLALAAFAWWVGYGMVFFASQALVAIRQLSLGAFFFYPAINILTFIVLVPVFIFSPNLSLEQVVAVSSACAIACAVVANGVVFKKIGSRGNQPRAALGAVFRLGITIAISRVVQTCFIWLPVWVAGFMLSPSDAGIFGVATRVAAAFSAAMAAVRFTIRPQIVAAELENNWPLIERFGRRIATIATFLVIIAIFCSAIVGQPILTLVFGPNFANVGVYVTIFMFAVLAESFGGPVDEVLRMTRDAQKVLQLMLVFSVLSAGLCFFAATYNAVALAWVQPVGYFGYFACLVWYLRRRRGILLLPYWKPADVFAAFKSIVRSR